MLLFTFLLTYIFQLAGQPLVLFTKLGDQQTLLPLGLSVVCLCLLQHAPQAGDVRLELRHLQLVLLLHNLQPPAQVILFLLQLLGNVRIISKVF